MTFQLGCQFTLPYLLIGAIGGLTATLIQYDSCLTMPSVERKGKHLAVYCGFWGRIIVAGIAGCVADCNNVNAFFGGFFAWSVFKWLSSEGWTRIQAMLSNMFKKQN